MDQTTASASPASSPEGRDSAARPYVKMNGAGNDFIVIQAQDVPFAPTEDQVRAIAARDGATGGCDQLISIEASEDGDAFMRVWNADGSMVQTCGNVRPGQRRHRHGGGTDKGVQSAPRPRRVGRSCRVDERGPA